MTWLTWRQFRAQAITAVVAVALFAILLAVTQSHMASLYDSSRIAGCHAGGCARLASTFLVHLSSGTGFSLLPVGANAYVILYFLSILVILAAPAIIGIFWGAPLIAREFEAGTGRLVWNQSITRTRWLTVKLALTGVAAMAVTEAFSLLQGWWPGTASGGSTAASPDRWNHAMVTKVATAMNVEIWSDVVCPWCYIGKRRFERAVASFSHPGEVTVTYRSFELDPDAPAQRTGTHAEHLARKYGMTIARAEQANQQMIQRAAAEGLEFRFDLIRGGNTFDAHRLLHLANDHGLQSEMKECLLRATFTEGLPIADRPTLVRLATEVGLPAAEVQAVLDGESYADAVRADEQQAARYGITGVPFFVADGTYAVNGAQPPEVLLQLLRRAYDDTSHLTPVAVTTDSNSEASCDGGSCAVG